MAQHPTKPKMASHDKQEAMSCVYKVETKWSYLSLWTSSAVMTKTVVNMLVFSKVKILLEGFD